ncbi:MAG TPA: (Fe-S)-binding protein [Ignavibacteriaceae bacterium]|nr:(Fe-S)-binding protein [Ignavibacteriaceae bacterium]
MNTSPIDNLQSLLPSDDVLSRCIHCGLCLSVCPTYNITKLERSSPRGRIKMIRSVAEGEGSISGIFSNEMNFCLDCQACETACPAGVQYGKLVESARVIADEKNKSFSFKIRIKKLLLNNILAKPKRLKYFSGLLRGYQQSSLKSILEGNESIKKIFPKLSGVLKLAPVISEKLSSDEIEEITFPEGEERYRTAFHIGCIMDSAFAEINIDTVEVLKKYGCKTFTPQNQICCGSLHAHNGEIEKAKELAKKNIEIFEKGDYEFLISNSAGCGAFMKEYGELLAEDGDFAQRAKAFSSKIKDISEFLFDKKPVRQFSNIKMKATYHDACHLIHGQKIFSEPRELLSKIPGLEIVELEESTTCCGSAGIYNVMRYEDSMKILFDKMGNIKRTNAAIVITGNPGCILQITAGAEKFNTLVKVYHPVTVLKMALCY